MSFYSLTYTTTKKSCDIVSKAPNEYILVQRQHIPKKNKKNETRNLKKKKDAMFYFFKISIFFLLLGVLSTRNTPRTRYISHFLYDGVIMYVKV